MGKDRRQFEETFLPFLDAAYNLARWIVRHDQDAQDIVQESYLRAFKGFDGFRGDNGRAWLLTIVRNTAYSWIHKHALDDKLVPYEEERHAEIISFDQSSTEIVSEKRKEYLQCPARITSATDRVSRSDCSLRAGRFVLQGIGISTRYSSRHRDVAIKPGSPEAATRGHASPKRGGS